MSKCTKFLLLSILLSISSTSSAAKYTSVISSKDYSFELSKDKNYKKKLKISDKSLNGNIIKTHKLLDNAFVNLQSLKQKIEPELKKAMEDSGLHFRWFNFSVTGPIEIKLSGTSSGKIKAEISKFSLYGKAKAEKSWYLNAYATLSLKNAYASGEYDPSTGKINNLQLKSKLKFDFDSTLNYVIPHIDDIASYFGKKLIIKNMNNIVSEYQGYKTAYGLNKVIPANKYVYNGIDFSWKLDQLLTGMIAGEFIRISINDVDLNPSAKPLICSQPGQMSWNKKITEISLSDEVYFKINRKVTQNCQWSGGGGSTFPDF
ncbi:hypothetical protein [uncultured Shewanella sp.]|uniref:hypothetical protein n=1 Tax=uncultured Shewanella sp. TaxID=173975 RepID=UPI0026317C43|nr:hypothetical protein [uncultured Shewanella sp.]